MPSDSLIIGIIEKTKEVAGIFAPEGVEALSFWVAFFMVFSIVLVALEATGSALFGGEERKGIRTIIALVIAYFSSQSPYLIAVVERAFPSIGILMIGVMTFMFSVYFIFPKMAAKLFSGDTNKDYKLPVLILMGVIILIFFSAITGGTVTDYFSIKPNGITLLSGLFISDYDLSFLILIAVGIIALLWVTNMLKIPSRGGS